MNPLRKAFFAGGCLGVLMMVLFRLFHVISPPLRAVLCPGCTVSGLYHGSNPWTAGVPVGLFEFALNFAVYGLLGMGVGYLMGSGGSGRTRN